MSTCLNYFSQLRWYAFQNKALYIIVLFIALLVTHHLESFASSHSGKEKPDLIIKNGHIATLNQKGEFTTAVAIKDGRFVAVGSNDEIMPYKGKRTKVIDAKGKTIIPGLNDSHLHVIRGGLNYNLELRWDGVTSLKDALKMIREQTKRTPAGQWVRVVGGWSEYQFNERRLPTLDEINNAAPNTPVFVLYLYAKAFLNHAALQAVGYTKETRFLDGEVQIDKNGNPTGLLIAKPNALILYTTLSKAPSLSVDDQINSTLHFMRELNRFGVTSAIDAGGGFQNYPENYAVAAKLAKEGKLTLRISYYLFAQKPKQELVDYQNWIGMAKPGQNDDMFHPNGYVMEGGGENLVWSAADFENFLEPRPELDKSMESELKSVVKLLVQNRWPFRIHATYDESIERFLNVFEEINKEVSFNGLRWAIDHAETISERNMRRVKALGGGIAIQGRMVYQGENFIARYGTKAAEVAPPVKRMFELGIPVGLGTDGTRVASYNPWVTIYWLVSGKTLGGTRLYTKENLLSRAEVLQLYTKGSAWFSHEEEDKGTIEVGKFADLAVLKEDYFTIPEERIKDLEADLTIVGGKVVYGTGTFAKLSPSLPPVSPGWSPVAVYGGYARTKAVSINKGIISVSALQSDGIVNPHKVATFIY